MFQQLDTAIAFVVVILMLSLLVTAIVQSISALLDLRGKNLTRALSDLFKQIDPDLSAAPQRDATLNGLNLWLSRIKDRFAHPFSKVTLASKAADAVAKHPVLAHTFTRAKAIRKDELLKVVKDLCSGKSAGKIDDTVRAKLIQILRTQDPAGGGISQLDLEVEKWFDTVMDRASDVFIRWTRTITIAVSILFVIILHIDSGLILKQISMNPGTRAGLTKLSDAALAQADETLKTGDRATRALNVLAEKHKGEPMGTDFKNAPPLVTCAEGKRWLEDYGKNKHNDMSQMQQEFADACQQLASTALSNSEDQISRIRQELAATDLKIVPDRVEGQLVFGAEQDSIWKRIGNWRLAYWSKSHALGTLATLVLLSLGAPFWYNALKQLTNLKPNITQKVEKESFTP